jgi:hypothetical protein
MLNRLRSHLPGLVMVCGLACLAPLAQASNITYSYTGNPYTYLDGFVCTQPLCGIQGSLTLAAPLAANLSHALVSPSSFNFTNGADSYTQNNVLLPTFSFTTDATANIIGWSIILQTPSSWTHTFAGPGFAYAEDTVQENYVNNPYVYYNPGKWTSSGATSETPEPATWALLGTGVLGLLGMAAANGRRLRAAGGAGSI